MIDTGPKFPGILETIVARLKIKGIRITDIERIIITHGHIDHFGLALSIQKLAGHAMQCFIHAADLWKLSRQDIQKEFWSREADDFITRVGIPLNKIKTIKSRFSFLKTLCDPVEDVLPMEDGDEFCGNGYHLEVVHTPGHSPGACCFFESENKILFSGDHVIKHITPNPLVELNRNQLRNPNYQSLKSYLDSLEKIMKLDVRWVFPGHGEYMNGLKDIITSYKCHHRQRQEKVLRAIKEKPRSVYALIDKIFPVLPDSELFLASSDIWAHLEILLNDGQITLKDSGPPEIYQAI
ncbi:MAG: MBL fold metallo-hydrolase [Proteobacteria bacterium]|nr:MBL fold metallo-hydrolase [Pseudomonadota bacterium]MBU1696762.1 MBL fold metallo-hydrolase [Pseudomonadota bacterium]